jgi:hypothetical protein
MRETTKMRKPSIFSDGVLNLAMAEFPTPVSGRRLHE